jgi:hypothetical protein
MLTDRARDVAYGRISLFDRDHEPQQGIVFESRLDYGTRRATLLEVLSPLQDGPAELTRRTTTRVLRQDFTLIYSWHPDFFHKTTIDAHFGWLASYTYAGIGARENGSEDWSGNVEARPFVLIPMKLGEITASAGWVSAAGNRPCRHASRVSGKGQRCNRTLQRRSHVALARPFDAVNILPAADAVRTALSWNVDLGLLAWRFDTGLSRVWWRKEAFGGDQWLGNFAFGLALSTTNMSVLIDYANIVTSQRGILHSLDPLVQDPPGFPHRTRRNRLRARSLAFGLRWIAGRHLQMVFSLNVLEGFFPGVSAEFPF